MGKKNNSNMTSDQYIHSMHKFGRICAIIAIIVMFSMPIITGFYFSYFPSVSEVITASVGLLAIFIPTSISEVISYTPILGSSIYLTLITGNVMNLKLPSATNAMDLLDCQYGTEEADIVSMISVSISSFTTIAIIALGVLLMIPLQPVLEIPAVKTASTYILPALFGNLVIRLASPNLGGGITSPDRLKAAILPVILVAIICIFAPTVMDYFQGVVILILIPILYFSTKFLYKKGKIHVYLPGEKPEAKSR